MPLCSDIVGIEPVEGVGIEPVEGDVCKIVRVVTNEEHRAKLGALGRSRNLRFQLRSNAPCLGE